MQLDSPVQRRLAGVCLRLSAWGALAARLTCAEAALAEDPPAALETAPAAAVAPPEPLSDTGVAYPDGASGDAQVLLRLVIDRAGNVQSVEVEAGEPPFAAAAREAALGWRFTPARRADQPIPARIRFRVEFRQETREPPSAAAAAPPEPAGSVAEPAAAAPAASTPASPAPPPLEVTVSGVAPVGSRTISRAFALQLPGAFGNPFAAIGAAPGVTPTLSGAPYFYVRGSPPGNLGYLLDDLRLPALFHVLAGPSVVHPALVESVDFFAGPYPARYGRFTGGIAAGRIRPASYALHGEASVRAFDSSGLVEVPLGQHTSATLAGRIAYANPIARLFAPEISVGYWDYQARFAHELSARDELVLFVFGARDDLSQKEDDGERRVIFGSEFHRAQLRYQRQLDGGVLTSMAVLGTDRSAQADGDVRLSASLGELRTDLEQDLNPRWRVQAGLDFGLDRHQLRIGTLDDPAQRDDVLARYPRRTDALGGGYLSGRWRGLPAISVTFGARVDAYRSQGELEVAPAGSILAEFELGPHVRLLHGLGIADQPPSSNVPQPGASPVLRHGLQHALQHSAGVRLELPLDLTLEATLYQVALFNLSDSVSVSRIDNGDDSIDEDTRATGSSRGLELQLQRALNHDLGGFLSYTLSTSRRSVGRAQGPALFDRRHVLSAALSYRWGSGFHSGLRGSFYTGIPADVAYLAAAQDPPRTSPFYRLDARFEKRWALGAGGAYWAIVAEVLNTTLQEEALGKSCNAYVCREDRVGPLTVPSLGLEAVF